MRSAAMALLGHFGRIVLGMLVIVAAVLSLFGCMAALAGYIAYLMEPDATRQGVQQVLAQPQLRLLATGAIGCVALSVVWVCWMVGNDTAATLAALHRRVIGDRRGLVHRMAAGATRFVWTSVMGAVSVTMSIVGIAALCTAAAAVVVVAVAPSVWSSVSAWLSSAGVTGGDVLFAVVAAFLCATWFLWSVGMDVTDR